VLGVSIVVAKVWNDNPVYNADFQTVLPQLTRNELLDLERVVLKLLQWDVEITPADYGMKHCYLDGRGHEDHGKRECLSCSDTVEELD
jgi:hypothetical protein